MHLRTPSIGIRFLAKVFLFITLCVLLIVSVYLAITASIFNYINIEQHKSHKSWKATEPETYDDIKPENENKPDTLLEDIQHQLPNLPIVFWNKTKNKNYKFNSTCAKFPDVYEIHYSNAYWQTLETSNGSFHFLGAYLDTRPKNLMKPTIRILGMINRIEPTVKTYCQIWFEGSKKPVISKIIEYKYIWVPEWGNFVQGPYQPYLMACNIPKKNWKGKAPSAVSVVEKSCDRSVTLLTVFYNKPKHERKDFAVCVKGLNYPYEDMSVKLVEWIELVHLLGADKIFFYELSLHPKVKQTLSYYEEKGIVDVTPLKLAGTQPSEPLLQYYYLKHRLFSKRQNEVIPYNDCFYKHMYEYKYIILLDIDEIIMPLKYNSWNELMNDVVKKSKKDARGDEMEKAFFAVQNVYFLDDLIHNHGWFDDIPKYMHMLQHVYRAKNFTQPDQFVKSFFNTEKTLLLHNHVPLKCLGNCYKYTIEKEDAQLQHYRKDCVNELKEVCQNFRNNSVTDTSVWKFKEPLIERVTSSLRDLGYLLTTP